MRNPLLNGIGGPATVALLLGLAAAPGDAAEVHLGLIGITSIDTARLAVYCDGSVVPGDGSVRGGCLVKLNFHDLRGRVLKETALALSPGQSGFLDLRTADIGLTARRGEIIPCYVVERGGVFGSLSVSDNLTLRTRVHTNLPQNPRPAGGELHFGRVDITPFDTIRLNAYCASEPALVDAGTCEFTFIFHDSAGRVYKQSTATVSPGSGASLELRASELGFAARQREIIPCIRVGRGLTVATWEMADTISGMTTVFGHPATLLTP